MFDFAIQGNRKQKSSDDQVLWGGNIILSFRSDTMLEIV